MMALIIIYSLIRLWSLLGAMVARLLPMSLLALLVLSAGCQPDEVSMSQSAKPAPIDETTVIRPAPTFSVAAETGISDSPAAKSLSPDPATKSPEAVCRAFMQRLQNDDRIGAENLLTRAALTTTQRANLKLEPISGIESTVIVHPARYASQLAHNAQVDCEIEETIDGAKVSTALTWQVVRQSNGWRVCGMVVPLDDADQDRLLSFESIDDVATIKLLAAGEEMEGAQDQERQQMRQADANEHDTSLQ
jgi:hypothetical protein